MKRLTAALIASIMLALCACEARPIVSNEGQNAPAGLPGLPETPIHTETQAPEGSYSTQTDVRYYPDGDKRPQITVCPASTPFSVRNMPGMRL